MKLRVQQSFHILIALGYHFRLEISKAIINLVQKRLFFFYSINFSKLFDKISTLIFGCKIRKFCGK